MPRVGSGPAAWSDFHAALSERFDLLAEPLAAPKVSAAYAGATYQRRARPCWRTGDDRRQGA